MKKKKLIILIVSFLILLILVLVLFINKSKSDKSNKQKEIKENKQEIKKIEENNKINIVDVNSTSRPLAVSVNNTPVAIKVQTGLNKAFLVYEIATEGSTSRLLALFKDTKDLKVGTIRSARHNFIDFALESDAILAAYGWSIYAEEQLKGGAINYVQGLVGEGSMWRENPEKLASEHTAYLNTSKVLDYANKKKKYKLDSTSADKTILLNYKAGDVDLTNNKDAMNASEVIINYGSVSNTFKYNSDTKMYTRIVNGKVTKDYATKEEFTTKNIIVERVDYKMCDNNYYWDLKTTGSGEGFYITNGKAVPIKWSKESRSSKTKYIYLDGKEIEVSDGRTYIEVQVTKQKTVIR